MNGDNFLPHSQSTGKKPIRRLYASRRYPESSPANKLHGICSLWYRTTTYHTMPQLTPVEKTILKMSARKDISFSDAELKFLDEHILEVTDMVSKGWIEAETDKRHVLSIIILEEGRNVWYGVEKAGDFADIQRR